MFPGFHVEWEDSKAYKNGFCASDNEGILISSGQLINYQGNLNYCSNTIDIEVSRFYTSHFYHVSQPCLISSITINLLEADRFVSYLVAFDFF